MDDWHVKQINAIKRVINPTWDYADVGACQGEILQYLFQTMQHGYAFEPDTENYDFLYSKFLRNRTTIFSKLDLIKSAVCNVDGHVKFFKATSHVGNILGHDMSYRPYSDSIEVTSLKLDTYFEDKKVDFIKVDIEGAEWSMFEGAQILLKERDIVWQVEFHLDEDWHRREILFDNGYHIYDLDLNKLSKDASRPYQAILSKHEYK